MLHCRQCPTNCDAIRAVLGQASVTYMCGFCALVDRDRFRPRGGQFERIGFGCNS